MNLTDFSNFLDEILNKVKATLDAKSADYSKADDKLFNFKLQARIDDITPVEALRGNWRKHLASIIQGLDELRLEGKIRPKEWFREKIIDSINYQILLLALLQDEYCDKSIF